MRKNSPQLLLYPIKGFKGEKKELHSFLEKNLSSIFPNISLLEGKLKLPYKKGKEIDTVAFHHEQDDKWKNLVLLEYKWKDNKDPQTQLEKYLQGLEKFPRDNLNNLNILYNNYLRKEGKSEGYWKRNDKNLKEFWKKCFLIAVARRFDEEQINNARHKGVFLVEIEKYGDSETEFVLVSVVEGKWRKLGMSSESIIIQTRVKKTGNIIQNEKALIKLEQFLKESKAEGWVIEKIKKIGKKVQLFDKSIEGKATQWVGKKHRYFVYYKDKKKLLCIYPQSKKKEFVIYLRENKTTANFDKNSSGDSYVGGFERMIIISDEGSYKKFFGKTENYLKNVMKVK